MAFAAHGHNYGHGHGGQYGRHHGAGDDDSLKHARMSLSMLTDVTKLLKNKTTSKENALKVIDLLPLRLVTILIFCVN